MRFVNAEEVVVSLLAGRPELAGVPVVVALPPDFDGAQRAVLVTRFGGGFSADDELDHARLRIDAYGQDKPSAHALATVLRGLMRSLTPAALDGGVVVTDVVERDGPYWHPDRRRADASRYHLRYRVVVAVRAT